VIQRILLALGAIAIAWTTMVCGVRNESRTGEPDLMSRHSRGQPFVSQTVLASGPAPSGTWSLSAYQSFVADQRADRITVSGTLPEGGRATLTLHHRPNDTTSALVLTAGEAPRGLNVQLDGAGQALRCTGSLPTMAPGPFSVSMERGGSGWAATTGGHTLQCVSTDSSGHPSVSAGLRRIDIDSIEIDGTASSPQGMRWFLTGLGVGLFAFLGMIAMRRRMPNAAALAAVGLLMGSPITAIDGARLAEALRLTQASDDWLPVTIALTLASLAIACGLASSLARRSLLMGAVPTVLLAAAWAVTWTVSDATGWAYTALFGAALGALVWAQVQASRLRFYNIISLALACALIGALEVMVRFSAVGNVWNAANTQQGAGSTATLIEQFEDLEAGQFTAYPAKGFPVRLGKKQASTRVVCLGASSTGGAFQNDSLAEFYPALLNQLSPDDTEVVNQGVGGWNSFHLRQFLDGHADRLNGEVWTIYLGVNENLPTAMPFADLYTAWKAGNLSERTRSLDNIRLFQGLRLLVRGMRPGGGVGVSASDLRENLAHIIDVAKERNVRVLLMSEGVRPDPRVLWHYFDVMSELAAAHSHVAYLDTASVLDRFNDRAFIDTNHLTPTGHSSVARAIDAELRRLGWY